MTKKNKVAVFFLEHCVYFDITLSELTRKLSTTELYYSLYMRSISDQVTLSDLSSAITSVSEQYEARPA